VLSEERYAEYIISVVTAVSYIVVLVYMVSMIAQIYGAGRVVVDTELSKKIVEGKAFSTSKRLTIGAGESVDILIENNSGKDIKLVLVEVTTLSNIDINIYDNVTVQSHGSQWTVRNLNLGSSNTIDVVVEDGGSYTGGELVAQKIGYGGAPAKAIGSAHEIGEAVIIPDKMNIMIRITNPESQQTRVSVVIIFYEAD